MILDAQSRSAVFDLCDELIKNSEQVFLAEAPALNPPAIGALFNSEEVEEIGGRYEVKLKNGDLALCSAAVGETSGNLWTNKIPEKGEFHPGTRLDRISYITQALLCSGRQRALPCCFTLRTLMDRISTKGNEGQSAFYIPFFGQNFNIYDYRQKAGSDEMLAVVLKNMAFAYLSDTVKGGSEKLSNIQKHYFRREYRYLASLADYWNEMPPSAQTSHHRYTANILLGEINKNLYQIFDSGEFPPIRNIELKKDDISINETNDEGEEIRQFSERDVAEISGTRYISDNAAAGFLMANSALKLLKCLSGSGVSSSIPTIFPDKRLNLDDEFKRSLPDYDEIADAEWVCYEKSHKNAYGQYRIKNTSFKMWGIMREGDMRWKLLKRTSYSLIFGKNDEVITRYRMPPEDFERLRLALNPIYKWDGKFMRYVGCSYRSPVAAKNKYLWVELDDEGKILSERELNAKEHSDVRLQNPDLVTCSPRGLSNIPSLIRNEFIKATAESELLSPLAKEIGEKTKAAIVAKAANGIINAFNEMAANSEGGILCKMEGCLHMAYKDILGDENPDSGMELPNPEAYFKKRQDRMKKSLLSAFNDGVYAYVLTDALIRLCTPSCNMNPSASPMSAEALLQSHRNFADRAASRGYNISDPEEAAKAFAYVKENFPSTYGDFAIAVRKHYGNHIFKRTKLKCLIDGKIEEISACDVAEIFSQAAIRDIKRELGVIASIAKGTRLSDKPVDFAKAAESIPHLFLSGIISDRECAAIKTFRPVPGKLNIPFSPFIIFGKKDGFRSTLSAIEKLKFSEIKKLSNLVSATNMKSTARHQVQSTEALPKIKRPAGCNLEQMSAINRLVASASSEEISVKNMAFDTLACLIVELCGRSGQTIPGRIWENTRDDAEYERKVASPISMASKSLAKNVQNPGGLLDEMRSCGLIEAYEKSKNIALPHTEVPEFRY